MWIARGAVQEGHGQPLCVGFGMGWKDSREEKRGRSGGDLGEVVGYAEQPPLDWHLL
jgi:hypothetical protein